MKPENIRRLSLALSLATGLLVGGRASGQANTEGAARPGRVPAIVAMVSYPLGGGPFEVIRRMPADGPDIILLTDSAGPQELSSAVRALMLVRTRDGDTASAPARLRMRAAGAPSRSALPWAPRVLADIRARPVEPLAPVGPARCVQIWLPRTHRPTHPDTAGAACAGDGCPPAASGAP